MSQNSNFKLVMNSLSFFRLLLYMTEHIFAIKNYKLKYNCAFSIFQDLILIEKNVQ